MAKVVGNRVRVLMNGQDISAYVYGVNIRADVHAVVETDLRLWVMPEITRDEEGRMVIHLRMNPPVPGPLASPDGPLRGITVRAEESP